MPTQRYEIRIAGRLSPRARCAFVDMDVQAVPAESVIADTVDDEEALYRLLALIQSLGLSIVSVHQVPAEAQRRTQDAGACPDGAAVG
jgi:hypothetical protein